MGTETETNVAVFNTFSVLGTKHPNKIPNTIARKIHSARKRSRNASLLIIEGSEGCDAVAGEASSETGSSSGKRFVD
jgi:hypothetical protein